MGKDDKSMFVKYFISDRTDLCEANGFKQLPFLNPVLTVCEACNKIKKSIKIGFGWITLSSGSIILT